MSRSGRVGVLCAALFVLLTPSSASAYVVSPTEGEFIPFNAQPITITGGDAVDGTAVMVNIIGEVGDFCPGTLVDGTEWSCTLPLTVHLDPGVQTLEILELEQPPETLVNITIGPSALALTTAEFTSPTTLEVHGVRDATGSSGVPYGVQASILLPFTDNTHTTVPCVSVGASGFTCTYEFAGPQPAGTMTDVALSEIWAEKTVATLEPVPVAFPGADDDPPVVDPPDHSPSPPGGSTPRASAPLSFAPGATGPTTTPSSPSAVPTTPEPSPTTEPAAEETEAVAAPASGPVDDDALRLLLLAAVAFAILAMIGPHGLAFASDQVRRQGPPGTQTDGVHLFSGGPEPDDPEDPIAAMTLAALAGSGRAKEGGDGTTHARRFGIRWGDRSWTWQLAGWKQVDRASRHSPMNLSRRLPLVARVGADANYLRAAFGIVWLLLPVVGLGLGIWAAQRTDGLPVPPSTAFTAVLVVLAVVDATSGAFAVLGFAAVVLFGGTLSAGSLSTLDGIRGLVGLAALWFAIPLVAAAARPFRRLAQPEHVYRWDRVGDGVIAAVVSGFAVYATAGGFGDLVGRSSAVSHHAGALALLAAAAVLGRVAVEEIVMVGYPARLRAVQHSDPLREASTSHELRGILVRGLLVALFASAAIGSCWQLWAGVALYVVPQLLSLVEDHLPNLAALHRRLPRGIVAFFLIFALGLVLAHVISDAYDDDRTTALRYGFMLLAMPPFVLGTLGVLGRTSGDPPWTWPRQLAGAVIVAATVVVAFMVF